MVDSKGAIVGLKDFEAATNSAASSTSNLAKETTEITNKLGQQSRSFNLAGAAALSLSQGISDIPYGFRGIANNIGQTITLFGMLSSTTNAATGAAYGLVGAIKAVWSALMGPMGLVFLLQGLLAVIQMFEDRAAKAARETSALAKQEEKMAVATARANEKLKQGNTLLEDKKRLLKDIIELNDAALSQLEAETIFSLGNKQKELVIQNEILQGDREKLALTASLGAENHNAALEAFNDQLKVVRLLNQEITLNEEILAAIKEARVEKGKSNINSKKEKFNPSEYEAFMKEFRRSQLEGRAKELADTMAFYDEKLEAALKSGNDEILSLEQVETAKKEIRVAMVNDIRALEDKWAQEDNKRENEIYNRHKDIMDRWDKLQESKRLAAARAEQKRLEDEKIAFNKRIDNIDFWVNASGMAASAVSDIMGANASKQIKDEKKLFEHRKDVAVRGTIIDTLVAAQKAFSSQLIAGEPTSYIRASVAAAAALAQGAARVAQIKAERFRGDEGGGGSNPSSDEELPLVSTTGFSNLAGGESPNKAIRVYVLENDVRVVGDKVARTKVRARV